MKLLKSIIKPFLSKNSQWKLSTALEKRIILAHDIIEQIKTNKFIASKGTYIKDIKFNEGDYYDTPDNCNLDIKSNFNKVKECKVCAIGSLFLSTIKYDNKLKFCDLEYESAQRQSTLDNIFEPEQLYLIECAFERSNGHSSGTSIFSNKRYGFLDLEKGQKAKYKYDDLNQHDKLITIMQNIIDNNGTFVV